MLVEIVQKEFLVEKKFEGVKESPWRDVDFHESSIIRINISKSRKAQSVPLSDPLAHELKESLDSNNQPF